jgi:hypothetical protein
MALKEHTVRFQQQVKELLRTSTVKDHKEIADAIGWDNTSLSNVMNGRRNIPPEKYEKFTKVYNLKTAIDPGSLAGKLIQIEAMQSVQLRVLQELFAKALNISNMEAASIIEKILAQELEKIRQGLK